MIGIMTATIQELQAFQSVLGTSEGGIMKPALGRLGNRDFVMMQCGAGKVNAAMCVQKMIDDYHPRQLIVVGVAGTLNDDLKLGSILISRDAVQHDFDTTFFGDKPGEVYVFGRPVYAFEADPELVRRAEQAAEKLGYACKVGRVATGDQFIATREKKLQLAREFQADCAEMEGAAAAQVCFVNHVPFVILRAISDESPYDYTVFCQQAAQKAVRLVTAMYKEE